MVDSFLRYISFEKRYSKHTVTSYENDLSQFQEFTSIQFQVSNLGEVTQLMMRSWVLSLVDQGISPRTVNRKIATLRSFYKYLLKREEVKKDPTTKIKSLKTKRSYLHLQMRPASYLFWIGSIIQKDSKVKEIR